MTKTFDTEEIMLRFDRYQARVAPAGAALRGLAWRDRQGRSTDLIWGYSGQQSKRAGQGDVLMPFPSRLRDGRYRFGDRELQLECNDKEGHSAIHGFLRAKRWDIVESRPTVARFETRIRPGERPGYPFSLFVTLSYELSPEGLTCRFAARNEGSDPAPFGAGFHPYFTVGASRVDHCEARIPAARIIELGPGFVPTGRILPVRDAGVDFRAFQPVGPRRLNHCFAELLRDPDGMARAYLRNPATGFEACVWMDQSFRYIVAYTGDAIEPPWKRQSLAIEPMTCATDAFNRPELGLITLRPDERCQGSFGISALSRMP